MCFYYCCSHPASLLLSFFFSIFAVVDHLEFRETSANRFGLSSSICDDCGLSEFLTIGEHTVILQTMPPRTAQRKDVNLRVVYAASAMGIGRRDISKFCKIFFHEQRYLAQPRKAAEKTLGELKRLKKDPGSTYSVQKYRVAQRQAKHKDEKQPAKKGRHNILCWFLQGTDCRKRTS